MKIQNYIPLKIRDVSIRVVHLIHVTRKMIKSLQCSYNKDLISQILFKVKALPRHDSILLQLKYMSYNNDVCLKIVMYIYTYIHKYMCIYIYILRLCYDFCSDVVVRIERLFFYENIKTNMNKYSKENEKFLIYDIPVT